MGNVLDFERAMSSRDSTDRVWIAIYLLDVEEQDIRMTREEYEADLRDRGCPERVVQQAIAQLPPARILSDRPARKGVRRRRREGE